MNTPFWDDLQLDAEEKEIEQSLEKGEFEPVANEKQEIERMRQAARYTLQKKKVVNLRLSAGTLHRLKIMAMEEGIPYQTYLASILHKHAHASKS